MMRCMFCKYREPAQIDILKPIFAQSYRCTKNVLNAKECDQWTSDVVIDVEYKDVEEIKDKE